MYLVKTKVCNFPWFYLPEIKRPKSGILKTNLACAGVSSGNIYLKKIKVIVQERNNCHKVGGESC